MNKNGYNDGEYKLSTAKECNFDFSTWNFGTVIKSNAFIDRTPLIKCILEDMSLVLITAPRRSGKSTNMNMLRKFLEIEVNETGSVIKKQSSLNYRIFKDNNLLIYQDRDFFERHYGTYPVIYVDFKDVTGNCIDEILDKFKFTIRKVFQEHQYLLNSDKLDVEHREIFKKYCIHAQYSKLTRTEIETGLVFLSECLYSHFNETKVYVLIDEYDGPLNNTMFKPKIIVPEVNELLRQIFSRILKDNQYVERALLTGISHFASVSLSEVDDIKMYMFLHHHPYMKFYGLTEQEVDALLTKFNVNCDMRKQVKLYYKAHVSLSNLKLFSMWSILHYLEARRIDNYWEQSGTIFNLNSALNAHIIRYSVEKLLLLNTVNVTILNKVELNDVIGLRLICMQKKDFELDRGELHISYLNFLLQLGYLSFEKEIDLESSTYAVKIPNFGIKKEFQCKIKEFYDHYVNSCIHACAVVINKMCATSTNQTYRELTKAFQEVISAFEIRKMPHRQSLFHSYLFNVISKSDFNIDTDLFDSIVKFKLNLVVEKNDLGIIFGIQYRSNSKNVLEEIIERKIFRLFDQTKYTNIKNKIYIGLNVNEDLSVTVGWLVNDPHLNKAQYVSIL